MALVLWECERNWRFLLRCVQLGRTSWKEERKRGRERERGSQAFDLKPRVSIICMYIHTYYKCAYTYVYSFK